MPQGVYIENPDNGTWRLKPEVDGSLNVNVLTVGEEVEFPPLVSEIVGASRDTTGTLYTVPAGRVFRGSLSLSACVAVAGTSQPTIGIPGVVLHKITINGLALSSVASANTISDVYIHGGAGGVAVTFTQGAAGTSTGQITGRLLL